DGGEVEQNVMARGVDGGDLQGADGRQAEPDGLAHAMVNVTFAHEVAGELVVGGEGAVLRVVRIDERQQGREISLRAAFAQQNVHAEAQLFFRFLDLDRFVVRAHAGQHVGVEIFSAQAGRV